MYLKGEVPEERNDDGGEQGPELGVFTQRVWPFSPITRAPNVSNRELNMAHWFVLYNTPEVIPYLEEHKRQVNEPEGRNITHLQREEFSGWFRDHINQLRSQGSPEATYALWALANDPSCLVHQYSGCRVNGVRFVTVD
ncbi:hypothetical protein AAC387_Pa01g3406 [Persea americana]